MHLTQPLLKALRECPEMAAVVFAARHRTVAGLAGAVASATSIEEIVVFDDA